MANDQSKVENKSKNLELKKAEEFQSPYKPHLDKLGKEIATTFKGPLVVMYYCNINGQIVKPDIEVIFKKLVEELKSANYPELNILLQTYGGDPNTAYKLVQTLRKFSTKLNFIVPREAYSGGTLMVLGGDSIKMGPFASLGPIDLQLIGKKFSGALANMEKYVEFVKYVRDTFSDESIPSSQGTEISRSLLLELTEELNPTEVGEMFRLRKLSEYYARILLSDYMFKFDDHRQAKVNRIVKRLNSENPDHSFDIDYHIAKNLGLKVELLNPKSFFSVDKFIKLCDLAKSKGEICPFLATDKWDGKERDFRIPFFQVYLPKDKKKGDSNG